MQAHMPPERTLFQEGDAYSPHYAVGTDAAVAYGVNATLEQRVAGWREHGYVVHLMTGLAWGHYEDYLLGRWDGRSHWDEAQYHRDGRPKLHGPNIPYMVPNEAFASYLEALLCRAVDAGVEAVFLEEPEFWSYTGYGPAFERAYAAHHGQPWRDPATDPHAFVLASEVKQSLYVWLIERLCTAVKAYSITRLGQPIRCYVATHSPLNYTLWGIVGAGQALRRVEACDGVIVQVWSFTARSQTWYEGVRAERLFEVAFLEYGTGLELVRASKRHLWFLADPVEDSPAHGWEYYRAGYERTVAASLFYPEVGAFQVMPWPMRVFGSRYPRSPDGAAGSLIPPAYAQELLVVAETLRTLAAEPVEWDCGTQGIGVLFADSTVYRRGGPEENDPECSSLFGLALPLLAAGMPVRPVGMEVASESGGLSPCRMLLLSYDGMTPPASQVHQALAAWVRAGGILLCFGVGNGSYETVPGWWNDGRGRRGPWPNLYRCLGLEEEPTAGMRRVGAGLVCIEQESPMQLAKRPGGGKTVRMLVREALQEMGEGERYREQAFMTLRRGALLVAACSKEAPHGATAALNTAPLKLRGHYIDLFAGDLPVKTAVTVEPGECALLLDLERQAHADACVVASAARIGASVATPHSLGFRAAGPSGTANVVRVWLPAAPLQAQAGGQELMYEWDPETHTVLARHPNDPEGVDFHIAW